MLQTVLLVRRLFVEQPVISGGLTLVVLHSLLCPAVSPQRTGSSHAIRAWDSKDAETGN